MSVALDEADIVGVCRINSRAAACSSIEEFERQVLPAVQEVFQLSVSTLSNRGGDVYGTPEHVAFYGGDAGASERYNRFYRHLANPYRDTLTASGEDDDIVDTQGTFASLRDRERSRLYREFQEPMGMGRAIAVRLAATPRRRVMLGLWRRHDSAIFDGSDKAKARMIAPVLQAAYARLSRADGRAQLAWLLQAFAPPRSSELVLLLDWERRVTFANAPAQELFTLVSGHDRPKCPGEGIPFEIVALCESAERLSPQGSPSCISLGGRAWLACATPIPYDLGGGFLVRMAPDGAAIDAKEKLGAFGLSEREIEVVVAVASGLSNKEIARNLGISYFTVQDHVKAIYRKLGVKGRVSLTNFLAGGIAAP